MNEQAESIGLKGLSRRAAILNLSLATAALPLMSNAETKADKKLDPRIKSDDRMQVAMVVFDSFQLLDVFGPL